jgi:hypothetical protein
MIDRPSSNTGGAVPPVVLSIGPVVLAAPGRAVDLHLRITAPEPGATCPSSCSRTAKVGRIIFPP